MANKRSSRNNEVESEKTKKNKMKKKMRDEGGINSLPDSMLLHVLSFLAMEEAVQTSLVSKRWRYLWTSLPTLNFTSIDENLVESVLILRDRSCNIQRFSITDSDSDSDSEDSRIYIWILAAIRHNVEEIHLEICFGQNNVKLPHCLFTCKTLRKLELISLDSIKPQLLILPDSICLPQLESLHLDGITLHHYHEGDLKINDFLSNNCCPGLESLTLNECGIHAKNLDIVAPKLKHFVINENLTKKQFTKQGGATGSIRLYAPNLISFHCKDYLSKTYSLENLSSLVEACIDMKVRVKKRQKAKILKRGRKVMVHGEKINFEILHNVKHLKLSAWALQIFIATYGLSDSASTEFHNLRSLELETWLSGDCIHRIAYLLHISPNILKLSLEIIKDTVTPVFPEWDEIKLNSEDIGEYLKLPLHCMLDHLKIVEIRGLKGTVNELKFLEALLKNAVVLEELIVGFSPDYLKGECFRERQLMKYSKIIQSLPRASSSVSILFNS